MSKTILKPCPFCGTEAELREHWGDCYRGPSWYEVECKNLDCGRCQDSPDEAVIAWNKRSFADYEALEAKLAEAKKANTTLAKTMDDMCQKNVELIFENGIRKAKLARMVKALSDSYEITLGILFGKYDVSRIQEINRNLHKALEASDEQNHIEALSILRH